MTDKRLSINFKLSEFNYKTPAPRLLYILQYLRTATGLGITITNADRTIRSHIDIYQKLEAENKIETIGNGLGVASLIDKIPWGSYHLPSWDTPYLQAVDFVCAHPDGVYSGIVILEMIQDCMESDGYKALYKEQTAGIGVGKTFCHLDVRKTNLAVWSYSY